MKLTRKKLRKLITKSLLNESSEIAYEKFVKNMGKFALFSEKAKGMSRLKVENPKRYKQLKALSQRLIKKIQNDFPGTIDIENIYNIIQQSKLSKEKDPSIDYVETVLDNAKNYWFNDIDLSKRKGAQDSSFFSADPKRRGALAKSLDRLLKHSWKQEADKPENKEFWDNFETWHAVGGIVGEAGTIDHQYILKFLKDFKSNNPDELSAYGWTGIGDIKSTPQKMNSGIVEIISNQRDWKNKVHVRLDGEVKFAANFDITTQWLSFKEEGEGSFEKAGDLDKMLTRGGRKAMITGPNDDLLNGRDPYNEIVIKNSKVISIAFPEKFFTRFDKIINRDIWNRYDKEYTNLFEIATCIKNNQIDKANALILKASQLEWSASTRGFAEIIYALVEGDIKFIKQDNNIISDLQYLNEYLKYDIPIYSVNGESKKEFLIEYTNLMNLCINFIENNPALKTRKKIDWYEWIKRFRPEHVDGINFLIQNVNKNKKIKTFLYSKKGDELIKEYFKKLKLSKTYLFQLSSKDKYAEIVFNPLSILTKKVLNRYMIDKHDWPLELMQLCYLATTLKKMSEDGTGPFSFDQVSGETNLSFNNLISPPYFINFQWRDNGQLQKYEGKQEDANTIIGWYNLVNTAKNDEYFYIWNPGLRSWVIVNSQEQLKSLIIPVMPNIKKIAEVRMTRKQLRKLILKEFNSINLNKNFIVDSPPPPNFPRGDDGGGDGESCDDYGVKWEKSYRKVMDAFNIAYPYSGGNHRVFLGYLSDSGIQLPFSADSSSKDLIDYVTDIVLSDIAMDVCNMKISSNKEYLVDLLKSPFSLLNGVDYIEIINGKKVKKKTDTYLPNAFLKEF